MLWDSVELYGMVWCCGIVTLCGIVKHLCGLIWYMLNMVQCDIVWDSMVICGKVLYYYLRIYDRGIYHIRGTVWYSVIFFIVCVTMWYHMVLCNTGWCCVVCCGVMRYHVMHCIMWCSEVLLCPPPLLGPLVKNRVRKKSTFWPSSFI